MCQLSHTIHSCSHFGRKLVSERCCQAINLSLFTGCFDNTISGITSLSSLCPACTYRSSVGLEGTMITHSLSDTQCPQPFTRESLDSKPLRLSAEEKEAWSHKIREQRAGSRKFSTQWGRVLKKESTVGTLETTDEATARLRDYSPGGVGLFVERKSCPMSSTETFSETAKIKAELRVYDESTTSEEARTAWNAWLALTKPRVPPHYPTSETTVELTSFSMVDQHNGVSTLRLDIPSVVEKVLC